MATPNLRALIQQRIALVSFIRHVTQARGGGSMNDALETLTKALPVSGALAYQADAKELALVGDLRLPRRAKPWLAHLPRIADGWFVAQRVAASLKPAVDAHVAEARMGHSIRPALEECGWKALCAAPILMGRELLGVIVLAAEKVELLDEDAMVLLEAICALVAFAEERERLTQRERAARQDEAKTSQLATMGLLAATAACDLAAPLAAIDLPLEKQQVLLSEARAKLYAKLGSAGVNDLAELDEIHELGVVMGGALRSAQAVTWRLMSFSKDTPKQTVDLRRVLEVAVASFEPSAGEATRIELASPDGLAELLVEGRREALDMLVTQLLLYATQECARAGSGTVRAGLSRDGARVELTVETSAAGHRTEAQVFDTYMTRQSNGKLTVGLALAKQSVLSHNGHVEYGKSPLGGLLIRVVLPAAAQRVERQRSFAPPPLSAPAKGPRPVLLWIDADETTGNNMRLGIGTHEVRIATTLAAARPLIEGAREAAVVFCDVSLPDGSGIELHRDLPQELKGRFVFMTAGVIPAEAASYLVTSGRPTLIKPISLDEITKLLEKPDARNPSIAPTLSQPPPDDDFALPREDK